MAVAVGTVGELDPKRRRALLETAAREFAAAGYERASLNRIIGVCRMSKSSFYHYFASKLALFDLVVADSAAALARELAVPKPRELAGPHFWDEVTRLADRLRVVSQRHDWYADLGAIFYLPDAPADSAALRTMTSTLNTWLDEALQAGRSSGAVRDDLPTPLQAELAVAVLRAMDAWSVRHLDEIAAGDGEALVTAQVDALRRLLAP